MASLLDFIKGSGTKGKSSTTAKAPQYVTPQGKATSSAGGLGQGQASQVNYLNPQATGFGYVTPLGSGTTQGTSTYSPYSGSYGGSSSAYGSGGGYAAQPDTTGLQDTARGLIQSIQNAYHSLQGTLNPVVQDKVNQYLQSYDTQQSDLNKQLGTATGQTQNIYGARGLQDSSFLGNALDENANIYNQNLTALNTDKTQKLGAIGQYAQGLNSSANAAADQYGQYLPNLGQYSASDLQSLNSSLQGSLPGIQAQVAGMGTNQDFLNTLNNYAPQANQGSSQLASKLQQLVTSSAPIFAKKQIASGLVKSANLQDANAQGYWNDYFSQLLNGQA